MGRKLAILAAVPLALAACSSQDDGETADDFAARVGGGQQAAAGGSAAPLAETAAADAAPPAGVDVTKLEKLGDISATDLGPRDGGCTFQAEGTEMLLAGAPADPSAPGKAVVRLGGKLYLLTLGSGGLPAVKSGASYVGDGVLVTVAPKAGEGSFRDAILTAQGADGISKAVSGQWVCS